MVTFRPWKNAPMTPSEPGRDQPPSSPRWVRWLGFTLASQWSTRRRVVYGLFAVILAATSFDRAVNGPHARGPWFGALAVLVYAGVFGWVILAPRGYDSWQRKHRKFDAAFFGPLLFLVLGYVTSLPLLWCAAITLVATPLVVLLGRRRRTTAD